MVEEENERDEDKYVYVIFKTTRNKLFDKNAEEESKVYSIYHLEDRARTMTNRKNMENDDMMSYYHFKEYYLPVDASDLGFSRHRETFRR